MASTCGSPTRGALQSRNSPSPECGCHGRGRRAVAARPCGSGLISQAVAAQVASAPRPWRCPGRLDRRPRRRPPVALPARRGGWPAPRRRGSRRPARRRPAGWRRRRRPPSGPRRRAAGAGGAADLRAQFARRDRSASSIRDSLAELRRIPTGKEPHHLYLTPDEKSLIVANALGDSLTFIDPATAQVQRVVTGIGDPYHLRFSPDMKWFVTAANRLDHVDIYRWEPADAATPLQAREPRRRAGKTPSHLIDRQPSSVVYASMQDSDELIAIDLATQKPRWKIAVGKMPADVYLTRRRPAAVRRPDRRRVRRGLRRQPARRRSCQAHRDRRRRACLPRRRRPAPRLRQQPRRQHHQQDRHADARGGRELSGAGRPRLHGRDGRRQDAARHFALGAQADHDRHRENAGRPADRGRPVAARRVDARPCAAPLVRRARTAALRRAAAACALAGAAAARRPRGAAACDAAALPHLRHRPHGCCAAGRRGAARHGVKATFFLANERRSAAAAASTTTGRRGGRRAPPKATRSARTPWTTSTGSPTAAAALASGRAPDPKPARPPTGAPRSTAPSCAARPSASRR